MEEKRTPELGAGSLKYISGALLGISLVMSHFALCIERYHGTFSEDAIINLWWWSWIPVLFNCVFVVVFRKETPLFLQIAAGLAPVLNLAGIICVMFYGFGHMTWS
jgi:hypothetical protein